MAEDRLQLYCSTAAGTSTMLGSSFKTGSTAYRVFYTLGSRHWQVAKGLGSRVWRRAATPATPAVETCSSRYIYRMGLHLGKWIDSLGQF